MKKTLLTLAATIAITTSAQAGIVIVPTGCLDNIGNYAKEDSMIKAWGIENGTEDTIVFVQNIRNHKKIDISFYGFNADMAKSMEESMGCKNVKFENAYNELGMKRY